MLSLQEFKRIAAFINDMTIDLLDGTYGSFGDREIDMLSMIQEHILEAEIKSKPGDEILIEINNVDRDLEVVEFLMWSKLEGTKYEEIKQRRKDLDDVQNNNKLVYDE